MAMITGGTIIPPGPLVGGIQGPGAEPDTKFRITWIENAVPTDALVGGSSGPGGAARVPANGEIACNVTTGNIYERQAAVWVRIDTL
jgi:hypothetical protein